MSDQACPFHVGQAVVFTHRSGKAGFPGEYGLPKVGDRVVITEIIDDKWVKWAGMGSYPGGGLHWSEFVKAPSPSLSP